MNIKIIVIIGLLSGILGSSHVLADDSDLIKADRQALKEAKSLGVSSKIIEAKEQLSDDLSREADQRRKDLDGAIIPLIADGQGHLLADVVINSKFHAMLIVDTGSPVVMLNSVFIRKLGIDPGQNNVGNVEVLNGRYKAAFISLHSLRVGEAKLRDVSAVVVLDNVKGIKYGILGMSFLSKFHFTLDQTAQKLILRKANSPL